MNMILISVYLFQNDVGMMLGPRLEEFFEIALNPRIEDTTSVFGRPHQMVVTDKDGIAHSAIHGHRYSICYSVNARTHSDAGETTSHELPLGELRGMIKNIT